MRLFKQGNFSILSLLIITFLILCVGSCITPALLVTQEQQKGDEFNNSNNYPEAIRHYFKCLESSMKMGIYRNYDMEAEVSRKMAHAYEATGNYKEGSKFLDLAYSLDSSQNNKLKLIEDLRLKGMNYMYRGDVKEGMRFLEKTLELNAGMEDSYRSLNQLSIAQTYLDLAKTLNALGYLEKSRKYAERSHALFAGLNQEKGAMESYLALANVLVDLGMLVEGEAIAQASMNEAVRLGLNTSRHEQLLSEIETLNGKYQEALKYSGKSLENAEKSNIKPQILWSHVGLGDIYNLIGNKQRANDEFNKALQIRTTSIDDAKALQASLDSRMDNLAGAYSYFSKSGSLIASGLTCLRLGEMFLLSDQTDSAQAYYKQAKEYFAKAGNAEGEAKSNLGLGICEASQKRQSVAFDLFNSVLRNTKDPETLWKTWYRKGIVYEDADSLVQAVQSYKEAIRIIENLRQKFSVEELKGIYFDNRIDVYNRLIRLMLRKGDVSGAWTYSEHSRARAFLDMLGNRKINVKKNSDTALINKEQDLRLQIRNLSALMEKIRYQDFGDNENRSLTLGQTEEELVRAQDDYNTVIQQIKISNPEYSTMVSVEPASLNEVQKILNDKMLLEYWVGPSETYVWIITKERVMAKVLPVNANKLAETIWACRSAIETRKKDDVNRLSGELYHMLILPVKEELKVKTIGIIPHGVLHFLPFNALLDDQGNHMVNRFEIFYTPSASVFRQCILKPKPTGSNFLGMALGDMIVGSFSSLPGTEREVKSIAGLFTNPLITISSATKESLFKKVSPGYDIIHIATHGYFNSTQPLYSFLLFAPDETDDGRLNAHEIFGLDLKARLVTLSACETALGEVSGGDELVGLSRAFMYAGTPAVIVSLWSVADEPTAMLMTKFYEFLRKCSIQEALTLAQREVFKKYPDPFYWAPFILIGNGDDQFH